MRYRSLVVLLLAIVMAATVATGALAGRPTCDEDLTRPWCDQTPSTTTSTTVPSDPSYWTCEARNDNGAMWPTGTYDDGAYHGDTVPVCIDIREEHRGIDSWTVTWSGQTARGSVKGLKFVFEEEVHANVFAETVVNTLSGTRNVVLDFGDSIPGNMVFVAMPHSGDKWEDRVLLTIRPAGT